MVQQRIKLVTQYVRFAPNAPYQFNYHLIICGALHYVTTHPTRLINLN